MALELSGTKKNISEGVKFHKSQGVKVKTASQEIAGDSALYFNPGDFSELASKMMWIYKDEEGRKKLIEKAKLVISGHTAENSAALLWQAIEKAMA